MTSGVRSLLGAEPDVVAGAGAAVERRQPADLGEILERVLNTGIVVAGEIRIDLLDIELLTIKLRLVITSLDRAEEVGLDWWKGDAWYSSRRDDDPSVTELVRESADASDPDDTDGPGLVDGGLEQGDRAVDAGDDDIVLAEAVVAEAAQRAGRADGDG